MTQEEPAQSEQQPSNQSHMFEESKDREDDHSKECQSHLDPSTTDLMPTGESAVNLPQSEKVPSEPAADQILVEEARPVEQEPPSPLILIQEEQPNESNKQQQLPEYEVSHRDNN